MKLVLTFALLVALISGLTLHARMAHLTQPGQATPPATVDEEESCSSEEDAAAPAPPVVGFGNKWTLEFDHASRESFDLGTSGVQLNFNGKYIKSLSGKDYEIHHEKFEIETKPGKNKLHFYGVGKSDGLGEQITNIKLTRVGQCGQSDAIINGKFDQGHKLGQGHKLFANDVIPGWNTPDNELEIGWGPLYNSRWPNTTYVAEADAEHNTQIYQEFTLDSNNRLPTEKC